MFPSIEMSNTTKSSPSPSAKATKPTPLLSSSLFTPTKSQTSLKKHADIFSPRPETPSPPQFPFLDSPTPNSKRRSNAPSPPTPPRPRRRHALSDTTNALPRHQGITSKSSFELILAAFPAPPMRLPQPFFRSLPASYTAQPYEKERSPHARKAKEDEETDSGSESDCRTITGIPATPSTANSGWDNFWSEPPSPAEVSSRSKHERLLTEAALIREAYLKLKGSGYQKAEQDGYRVGVDERYH